MQSIYRVSQKKVIQLQEVNTTKPYNFQQGSWYHFEVEFMSFKMTPRFLVQGTCMIEHRHPEVKVQNWGWFTFMIWDFFDSEEPITILLSSWKISRQKLMSNVDVKWMEMLVQSSNSVERGVTQSNTIPSCTCLSWMVNQLLPHCLDVGCRSCCPRPS